MTGPAMVQDDDPVAAYLKTKQRPAEPSADPVSAYLATRKPTGHAGKPFVDAPAETAPGIGTKALGVLAALNRDIPGAEAAQAGVRSLVRGQPYREARADIRGAEDDAPTAATLPARLLGGGLAAAVLPGGVVGKGAAYGGLSGLGDSEEQSADARVTKGVVGAAVGGLAGAGLAKTGAIGKRAIAPVMRLGKSALGAMELLPNAMEGNLYPAEVMRAGPRLVKDAATDAVDEAAPTADKVVEAVKARPQRGRTNRQLNADATRLNETVGTNLPHYPGAQGAVRPDDAPETGADLLEALRGFAAKQAPNLEEQLRLASEQVPYRTGGDLRAFTGGRVQWKRP